MRGNTTLGGENAFGGDHSTEVFGAGFVANEEDFFTLGFGGGSAVGVEVNFAGSGTGTCGEAGSDGLGLLDVGDIEDRGEELVKLIGRIAQDGGFPVDEFFLHHVSGKFQRGGGGALAVAGLQHEEAAFLHGELDVLHVLEMLFEDGADFHEFGKGLGHGGLELGDRLGGADTGDDVFALGIDEKFTVEFVHTIGGIPREGHAGTRGFARVAIDHGLDVDGGAPFGGDVVFAAINDRALPTQPGRRR